MSNRAAIFIARYKAASQPLRVFESRWLMIILIPCASSYYAHGFAASTFCPSV